MMITGQGNGQGGREVGQKANQLPGYRHIDVPEERQYIAAIWGIPEPELPQEGAAATEMVNLMATGEIKSCLILCSNLMVSLPDNAVVARALDNLDPLVVIDFFLSETAERADVVLPGSVWCEDEGTTTNLEGSSRQDQRRRATRPARPAATGRSCPSWRGGWGAADTSITRSTREIWDELRFASQAAASPTITASPGRRSTPRTASSGPARPRTIRARRACSPSGSGTLTAAPRCSPIRYEPPAEEPSDDFPFRLTTGRVVYHYLSGTQTRRLGFLNAQAPEPWVEIHPMMAERLGHRATTSSVRVRTPRGAMELQGASSCRRSGRTPCSSRSTTVTKAPSISSTNPAVDPTCKIPEYKVCAAAVERLDAAPGDSGAWRPRQNYTPRVRPEGCSRTPSARPKSTEPKSQRRRSSRLLDSTRRSAAWRSRRCSSIRRAASAVAPARRPAGSATPTRARAW